MNLRTAFIRLAHENPETRPTLLPLVKQADRWEKMPEGWTDESRKQFWETLTGDVKHKVTKCIKEMEGKFDDPGAFCASLADRVDPGWRSRTASIRMTAHEYVEAFKKTEGRKDEFVEAMEERRRRARMFTMKKTKDEWDQAWDKWAGGKSASEADRVDPGWRSRTAKSAARAKLNGLIVRPIGNLSITSVGREGESFKIVFDGIQTDYYDEDDIREYNVYRLKPLSGGKDLFPNAVGEHTLNQWLKQGARGKAGLILADRRASEEDLRSRVAHLAHTRPELRAALLPLLK